MDKIKPRLSITKGRKTSISLNIDDINQLKFNNNSTDDIKLRNNITDGLDVKIIINNNIANAKLYQNKIFKHEYIININQKWFIFISHGQKEGGDQCYTLSCKLTELDIKNWYDIKELTITTLGNLKNNLNLNTKY